MSFTFFGADQLFGGTVVSVAAALLASTTTGEMKDKHALYQLVDADNWLCSIITVFLVSVMVMAQIRSTLQLRMTLEAASLANVPAQ